MLSFYSTAFIVAPVSNSRVFRIVFCLMTSCLFGLPRYLATEVYGSTCENLDLNGIHVGPETGNSGRRLFMGLGDDQSMQMQEMHHWMRSAEERLAQKSCRKRGRSHLRSRTRDSRSPNSRERHPRKRSRSKEWKRSPSPVGGEALPPGRGEVRSPAEEGVPLQEESELLTTMMMGGNKGLWVGRL
ncbi:hypothetical protein PIB30_070015 [Stylosanthes scabra]|uniref:Uncharacterized protein n=1 Tax=Stylosanthes scabra TaxID=79078 RepID=A0ABU6UNB0_9FABA|nr:hypothetical protein [Stylosanthes scabra]